jgi:hypothetical protein
LFIKKTPEERIKSAEEHLKVAEDLLKLNQLKAMTIPTEPNGSSEEYCTLAEAAGGVTEKVSLVRLDTVLSRLSTLLVSDKDDTLDGYIQNRNDYKLSTDAIIKLPKYGSIEEVQREHMALTCSRLLGLDTTRSTMMTHDGKPALFVPFDNIQLMSQFAQGKTLTAIDPNLLKSRTTYQHYSTLNPVGAGLQPEEFIEDFGKAFSLFYLCMDTDSIGGYNQNKALKDNRSLFVFDQVVMTSDKMKLDSRLSLQPDEFIMKHTRHGQGRNRTLIEDAPLSSKYESLRELVTAKASIEDYITRTISAYNAKIDEQNFRPEQKNQLICLRDDAQKILTVIQKRIDKIDDVLPKASKKNESFVSKALILEKLMHNPVLFTDQGRPYRHPWTHRHDNPVKRIETKNDDKLVLIFERPVSTKMVAFLNRSGLSSLSQDGSSLNQVSISSDELNSVQENMLYPECTSEIDDNKNYLDAEDLSQISKAYGKGHRTRIMNLVTVSEELLRKYTKPEEQITIMNYRLSSLQNYINTAKDKGFGMHVMKKMHFDSQQRLQKMIPECKLKGAFAVALKLDQVALFNKVVASVINKKQGNSEHFKGFITTCQSLRSDKGMNHKDAKSESELLKDLCSNPEASLFNAHIEESKTSNIEKTHDFRKKVASGRRVSIKHNLRQTDEYPAAPYQSSRTLP